MSAGRILPEFAAMERRWGPPLFWRGRRMNLVGARTDEAAVQAWAEFERDRNGE
ncbi:hypothetical protein [Mycolicibacterium hippocampi]|uniref:Uncharacterized protein n=1 Tax=Mycolicibacterium hippocampi TaxID=659824 RepID=A0A7I9ZVR1_9MYCO|nr:hypothetical protein [Mycolicibacterium hippocampi]GFH05034.1 hypothetical protein MHIP_55170 [Mycolicibacterium hippocampi]